MNIDYDIEEGYCAADVCSCHVFRTHMIKMFPISYGPGDCCELCARVLLIPAQKTLVCMRCGQSVSHQGFLEGMTFYDCHVVCP